MQFWGPEVQLEILKGRSEQERLLRSVCSGRKNPVSTTGQEKQDSRVQKMREPTLAAVMSNGQ